MKRPDAKAAVDKEWGKVTELAGMAKNQSADSLSRHSNKEMRFILLRLWDCVISKILDRR